MTLQLLLQFYVRFSFDDCEQMNELCMAMYVQTKTGWGKILNLGNQF